jgi:hypothetical protein
MVNKYCTATNTGKGFLTHKDRRSFDLLGHPGEVWVVGDNIFSNEWIDRVSGVRKTKAEAQAIVDGKVEEQQVVWDGLNEFQQAERSRPVKYNLP